MYIESERERKRSRWTDGKEKKEKKSVEATNMIHSTWNSTVVADLYNKPKDRSYLLLLPLANNPYRDRIERLFPSPIS